MSSTCPKGHASTTDDFCDTCGTRIGPAEPTVTMAATVAPPSLPAPPEPPPPPPPPQWHPAGAPVAVHPAAAPVAEHPAGAPVAEHPAGAPVEAPAAEAPAAEVGEPTGGCPACGSVNPPDTRFCETCGASLTGEAPPAPAPSGWVALAVADRTYFDRMSAEGITFPAVYVDRRFPLAGGRVVVGRRSVRKGLTPEIDLSAAPEDIGVSHQHCVLVADADGWSVVDPGSTNGTYLNDSTDPVPVDQPVRLQDGDRIHVGAWTTITLQRT